MRHLLLSAHQQQVSWKSCPNKTKNRPFFGNVIQGWNYDKEMKEIVLFLGWKSFYGTCSVTIKAKTDILGLNWKVGKLDDFFCHFIIVQCYRDNFYGSIWLSKKESSEPIFNCSFSFKNAILMWMLFYSWHWIQRDQLGFCNTAFSVQIFSVHY